MIDLQPSSEQNASGDSVAAFLADRLPRDRLRPEPQPRPNMDFGAWAELGALGVFALGLPEDCGGAGYGLMEEMLVHREFGRFLLSPSVIATPVAAKLAAAAGDTALASRIGAGEVFVAPALAGGCFGRVHLLDAPNALMLLSWGDGSLSLQESNAVGDRVAVAGIDTTVALETANLSGGQVIAAAEGHALSRQANLLVCAYLVGIAEAACEQSVAYAKVREQFDQPIGAFQAVKHRCADMLMRASAAWNLTLFAALADVAGGVDAGFQASAARLIAADAALRNAAVNIQNHGGIGFTGEHDAHHFLKRAHMLDRFGGGPAAQKKRMLAEPSPFSTQTSIGPTDPVQGTST